MGVWLLPLGFFSSEISKERLSFGRGGGGDFGGCGAYHNFLVNGLICTEACKQLIIHTIEEEKKQYV